MISGTFHPISQEWRYFSREKAIVHTLHLAQLVPSSRGDTVLIASTPPKTNVGGKGGGAPMPMPSGPSFITNINQITNNFMIITCYGGTNEQGQPTAQSKMSIQSSMGGAISRITFNPEESGLFVVGASCYSDYHTKTYQGAAGDGKIRLEIIGGGQLCSQAEGQLFCAGAQWQDPNIQADVNWRLQCTTATLAWGGSFVINAYNLGSDSALVAYAMKVADFG